MDFHFSDYLNPSNLYSAYKVMMKTPRLPAADIERQAHMRLQALCQYAYKHVPYYKQRFNEVGFDPNKPFEYENFQRIPILTKEDIRAAGSDLHSDEFERLGARESETSGSTGTPLHFYLDTAVNTASFLLFYRTWRMAPWRLNQVQGVVSGYAEGVWNYNPRLKILYLSSFHLDEENVHLFHELLTSKKTRFIRGYPSSLYRFAQLLDDQGLSLHYPMMFSGAETLLPYQREYIEKSFGGKVIDHYTHWERTASIRECMHGSLHAENDYGFHEILDANDDPTEAVGRLVCTGLFNRAMPLIRYDTKDLAQWDKSIGTNCPCGVKFPVVERIIGRVEDIVVKPEGRYIGRLDAAFKYNKDIKYAFIHQPDTSRLIVSLCPNEDYRANNEIPLLESELRKRVGDTISLEFKTVDEAAVPFTPAGKVRFVTSDVLTDMQTTLLASEDFDY